jgi:predicted nucleotidyltransferase
MKPRITVEQSGLEAICRRYHVRSLAFFGSVLRDDFRPDSDVDVLVDFEPGQTPGWGFITLGDELGDLLGRRVDLHTPRSISPYFRDQVMREASILYVQR